MPRLRFLNANRDNIRVPRPARNCQSHNPHRVFPRGKNSHPGKTIGNCEAFARLEPAVPGKPNKSMVKSEEKCCECEQYPAGPPATVCPTHDTNLMPIPFCQSAQSSGSSNSF